MHDQGALADRQNRVSPGSNRTPVQPRHPPGPPARPSLPEALVSSRQQRRTWAGAVAAGQVSPSGRIRGQSSDIRHVPRPVYRSDEEYSTKKQFP